MIDALQTFDWFQWVGLPLLVFLARLVDVALGTLRIIFLSRGRKYLAPLLGFVEVLIWITIVSQIVGGARNFAAYLAYAAGFAAGNYVGMLIEERLAIGTLVIRIIISQNGQSLIENLREAGYGVTHVDGSGSGGPVKLIYTVVQRKEFAQVVDVIQAANPKAFFTVEELRSVQQGIFPVRAGPRVDGFFGRKAR